MARLILLPMVVLLYVCLATQVHCATQMKDGEPVSCDKETYNGQRWRVHKSGMPYHCRCGYTKSPMQPWHPGLKREVICDLEGCLSRASEAFVRPGKEEKDRPIGDAAFRCVPGSDRNIMDAMPTLYYLTYSPMPVHTVPTPGCMGYMGDDVTAPGDSIEIYNRLRTCMVGPGNRADDPYGVFYWKHGDPVKCAKATYRGERWRAVNDKGEAEQCLCGYTQYPSPLVSFQKICKLEGCRESPWSGPYIRPGEVAPNSPACRCVPRTNSFRMHASTLSLYRLDCTLPAPGCRYSRYTRGNDATAAPGESIEQHRGFKTCMAGPGTRADDPYGYFYWKYREVINCTNVKDRGITWKAVDEKGKISRCKCDDRRPYGRICRLEEAIVKLVRVKPMLVGDMLLLPHQVDTIIPGAGLGQQ